MKHLFKTLGLVVAAAIAVACTPPTEVEDRGGVTSNAGGSWQPPENDVSGVYTSAGAWNGGKGCSGGIRPGAQALADQLEEKFEGITEVGGYSCRQNTANASQLSVHGSGRALDVMLATSNRVDNGTAIADFLVANAESLGIQMVIYNHSFWQITSSGSKSGAYSGPNPHTDHVHVEVTEATAENGPGQATTPNDTGTAPTPMPDDAGTGTTLPEIPACVSRSAAEICAEAKTLRGIECGKVEDDCFVMVDCDKLQGFGCASTEFCGEPFSATPNKCQKKKDGPQGEFADDPETKKNDETLSPTPDDPATEPSAANANDPNKKNFKRPSYTKSSAGCSTGPTGGAGSSALPALALALGAVLARRRRKA